MKDITNIEFRSGSKEERLPGFAPDFPYIASRAELDKYSVDVEKLRKSAEALNSRRSEEHAALERAQSRADAAEAEIIRLKAKLYDFMTAAKD